MSKKKKKQKIQSRDNSTNLGFQSINPPNLEIPKSDPKPLKKSKTTGIPKEVANRMARRILFTTGIPTISGMSVFIISYLLISRGILEIAPAFTLLLSGSLFFLGLVGLSYGILSASWDKNKGTFLGLENIKPNINRMKEAFRPISDS